jgi:hypothetical protein
LLEGAVMDLEEDATGVSNILITLLVIIGIDR